ncbi:hypothetical protein K474DRAFT_174831 [Panus rudis PR-1116 ss-1]|nr:hypothetical protein K474DRAFT_174831 [Panus rudis PR-1116 ss-1]
MRHPSWLPSSPIWPSPGRPPRMPLRAAGVSASGTPRRRALSPHRAASPEKAYSCRPTRSGQHTEARTTKKAATCSPLVFDPRALAATHSGDPCSYLSPEPRRCPCMTVRADHIFVLLNAPVLQRGVETVVKHRGGQRERHRAWTRGHGHPVRDQGHSAHSHNRQSSKFALSIALCSWQSA